MKILVIDIGGTHLKVLAIGQRTPRKMVTVVKRSNVKALDRRRIERMEMTRVQIKVLQNHDALVQTAAERFVTSAVEAIRACGRFHVALSGGTTPKRLYTLLATDRYVARVDWSRVHVFWGDERCVPPADPMSNCRIVRVTLIDQAPLPAENVRRICGEDDPVVAAAAYKHELRRVLDTSAGPPPSNARFDLILLGMGDDGHTAALFPRLTAVSEHERWVMALYVAEVSMWRVTCTPVLFNAAAAANLTEAGGQ